MMIVSFIKASRNTMIRRRLPGTGTVVPCTKYQIPSTRCGVPCDGGHTGIPVSYSIHSSGINKFLHFIFIDPRFSQQLEPSLIGSGGQEMYRSTPSITQLIPVPVVFDRLEYIIQIIRTKIYVYLSVSSHHDEKVFHPCCTTVQQ